MRRRAVIAVLCGVAVLVASAETSDEDEGVEAGDGSGGCACAAGRGGMLTRDVRGASTASLAGDAGAAEGWGAKELRNRTADICATGTPFYEGYVEGCFHWYRDGHTGSTDCGMVRISGGAFAMGTDFKGDGLGTGLGVRAYDNLPERYRTNGIHGANEADAEYPSVETTVGDFMIDRCEVTNAQFKEFVDATEYVTDAEMFGWSFVMEPFVDPALLNVADPPGRVEAAPWWRAIEGASWEAPEGPGSDLDHAARWHGAHAEGVPRQPGGDRMAHPVSHMSWRDAYNFCRWRGKRLLSEAEWEYAARGGHAHRIFPWGDNLYPAGAHMQNIWQGDLRGATNTAEDGYRHTAPTASYPPNDYGLYDMTGNIWEWVQDDYARGERQRVHERTETKGSDKTSPRVKQKTKRGGSHMCHAATCNRYRNAGRTGIESDSSAANLGFRCGKDIDE